jgi:L-asparaginase/Glu-tRNA(Gln) amidotransferase subunit D
MMRACCPPSRSCSSFTGAIRPATAPGADGPANLLDAVSVAASEEASGMGVLVVFGGEIHHARCTRKTDTTSLVAFSSPQTGPLGRVTEGHPTIWSRLPRNPPLDPPSLDRRRGTQIIPAGFLSPQAARMKLLACVASGLSGDEVRWAFRQDDG